MGYPMARNLLRAGHEVALWSNTAGKARQLASEEKGLFCHTPRQVAENADYIFLCVGNTDMAREVILGDVYKRQDLLIYVAGADPYMEDQLGGLSLTFDGLKERDRLVIWTALTHRTPVAIVLALSLIHICSTPARWRSRSRARAKSP